MTRRISGMIAVAAMISICHVSKSRAQDVDVLDLAASLTAQSSELQKVNDELKNKSEEVKKQLAAVKQEEQKVDEMKAASEEGSDPGPLEGPFYLFTGAYSNTQDRKGAGESEAFGGPSQGGKKFDSIADAHAEAKAHMSGGNQPSFRIEDKKGAIIESGGPFGNGKTLSATRLANPTAPKPDNSALENAAAALADRRAAAEQVNQAYLSEKATYDKKLAEYNAAVTRVNQGLPAALQEIGTPTPTAAQQSAPKGDYQVEDLGTIATNYKGKPTKDGTAASFVQDVAKLPDPSKWGKGPSVKGANLRAGTPIATLKADGYTPGPGDHAAIYVTQNKRGIWVYDQYKTASGEQRPVDTRFIRFKTGTSGSPSNDANAYSVITKLPE